MKKLHFDTSVSFFVSNSPVNCSKMFMCDKLSSPLSYLCSLYVLVQLEFDYDTFPPPSSMVKTIQCDGLNVTFSFLSLFSCGMVWVEEQKNNACKFPFLFDFVVLVKFLDKRALKMSKLS